MELQIVTVIILKMMYSGDIEITSSTAYWNFDPYTKN